VDAWRNIWKIVKAVKSASNQPKAIYFLDEPFDTTIALSDWKRDRDGKRVRKYVPWQFPSYVCTLRQAMAYTGLNAPVFTILTLRSSSNLSHQNEIRSQMPTSGCSGAKSTLDWVGIDYYPWSSPTDIYNAYNALVPADNRSMPKWILVPPASGIFTGKTLTDAQLHSSIKAYWHLLFMYPNAPVIAVMNFRFDPAVMATSNYPKSAGILSYMGNILTK
jgi:hypothetical protein